jgi:xanthine phosphoribosyltransferase
LTGGTLQRLEDRILKDGVVKGGNILKVDSFLNHQIDVSLYDEIGEEFHRLFKDEPVTKVLTVESSGIGLAVATARAFGVPALFAKKNRTRNIDGEVYSAAVESFTSGITYTIIVSKRFLTTSDHVLIIDDFLAKGQALLGLLGIVNQSGASVAGCGIAIEKGFQEGGKLIRDKGIRVESLAIIDSMEDGIIKFRR